mmetsp:Transcript_13115/g.24538  ORF Transcript_13115/g.24538 Transcript_13115/m.24538 type:complete len:315 (-) Transcript_13115:233-1177(-)
MQSMDEEEVKSALQSLHNLFKEVYISNCNLDSEEATSTELKAIEDFDFIELVENLREIVMYLVAFKREYSSSEQGELMHRSEQLEQLLQKLEAESRKHIRVEQQLKLHIESLQVKVEQTERDKCQLEQYQADMKAKLEECEAELSRLRNLEAKTEERFKLRLYAETPTPETMIPLTMKSKVFHRRTREGSRPLGKLELDIARLKAMLDAKDTECKKLKQILKAYRLRHESADLRQEHAKSPVEYIDNVGRKLRQKKAEITRKSMGDFNPKQLFDPPSNRKKDLKLDRVTLFPRSSPVRTARSRSELSQRGLFPK